MSSVPAGLKYSKEHEWVKLEGGLALVGITDHAQSQLGDIVFIELPKAGAPLTFMKPFGVVESVKAASDLFSPLNGKVMEVNQALSKSPESVNKDPYGAGWMIKVQPSDLNQLSQLLDDQAYTKLVGKA